MRAASVAGLAIIGGLVAVAVARRRGVQRPEPRVDEPQVRERAPAPVELQPAVASPLAAPIPEPSPVALFDGATALAPALDLEHSAPPEERPALHLVAAPDPPTGLLPEPPSGADAVDADPDRWETCEIRLWRGYVSWQLVAASPATSTTVALSPPFRSRSRRTAAVPEPARNEAARRAVEALQAMLESHGWERVADGDAWYEGRFRRPR